MRSYLVLGMLALALGAAPAMAQSEQSAPPPQGSDKPAQKPPQKSKKVWTDDNLSDLRGTVTTASAAPVAETAAPAEEAGTPAKAPATGAGKEPPPEKTAKYYQEKLGPLRKQLADTEAKIKQIQDAIDNPGKDGSNKINVTQSAPPGPPSTPDGTPPRADNSIYGNAIVKPQDQLTYYENQRRDLQAKIDDLEAKAISNGLTRGEIQ